MELEISNMNPGQNSDENKKMLESPENMVYSCLGLFPKSIGQLLEETGLCPKELLERLITLELSLIHISTLRFSMSEFTTREEIDYTLDTLYNIVPMLRKYTRR